MFRNKESVGIVNLSGGNVTSLCNAIDRKYFRTHEFKKVADFKSVDSLIIPGVGNIGDLSSKLLQAKDGYLGEHIGFKKNIIGICMGLQILSEFTEETSPPAQGLELVDGHIVHLRTVKNQIGWNNIKVYPSSKFHEFDGFHFYFNHSYRLLEANDSEVTGVAYVNEQETIPALVEKRGVVGFQFHPEKSQEIGKRLLTTAIGERSD